MQMSKDFKRFDSVAYRNTVVDGLTEIAIGLFLLLLAVALPFGPYALLVYLAPLAFIPALRFMQRRFTHPRIGFVELDAQGGELNALRGARGLLSRKAIDALMIEVFWAEVYKGASRAQEVFEFMADMGYVSLGQTPQRPWADNVKRWGDVIYWRGQG